MTSETTTPPAVSGAPELTEAEKVAACRRGERVTGKYSMFAAETGDGCKNFGFNHSWRTIACADDYDVDECRRCGRQAVHRCSFDEEMS